MGMTILEALIILIAVSMVVYWLGYVKGFNAGAKYLEGKMQEWFNAKDVGK